MKRAAGDGARKATGRRTPRRIGPAVLELVRALQTDEDTVEIRLSAAAARAICAIDARRSASPATVAEHPAHAAARMTVTVDHDTAIRWRDQAWQAVSDGLLAPTDAQALSDQLEPRGAA